MSKVKTISIENFKAIEGKEEINFNGCTAIVTGPNEKGKTSLLKGIVDRIMFIRPDVIVHKGQERGTGSLVLDTDEKFEWEFDNKGKDKLWYYDKENIKHNVTVALGAKFFPKPFDIDKFIHSTPKEQSKQLQAIVGLDFTDIEARYEIAYADRTEKNRQAELHHVKLSKWEVPEKVAAIDLLDIDAKRTEEKNRLNDLYRANKESNAKLRTQYENACKALDATIKAFNDGQDAKKVAFEQCSEAQATLAVNGYQGLEVNRWLQEFGGQIAPKKVAEKFYPPAPTYIEEMPSSETLTKLDEQILKAVEVNTKAKAYHDYVDYKQAVKDARQAADDAEAVVIAIEVERETLIKKGKFPKDVTLTFEGFQYKGLPFNEKQVSKARLYIVALQIAFMNIGEVKTLYFDASTLDKNSFNEIHEWSLKQGYQLLIEKPSWDADDKITYELIETL